MVKHLVFVACAFALVAATTRYLQPDVHSRLQIAAFYGLALFFEVEFRTGTQIMPSAVGIFANGTAAAIAIIAMKIFLEGLPHHLL